MKACSPHRAALCTFRARSTMKGYGMWRTAVFSLVSVTAGASWAAAHEVHFSVVEARIIGTQLELKQTSPIYVVMNASEGAPDHASAISELAADWTVSSAAGECALIESSYRLTHHDAEFEARFIYDCPPGAAPTKLSATWMTNTPRRHFTHFTVDRVEQRKTVVFRQELVSVDLESFVD